MGEKMPTFQKQKKVLPITEFYHHVYRTTSVKSEPFSLSKEIDIHTSYEKNNNSHFL